MRTIRILLADDHAIVRAGLRHIISAEGDLRVVGEVETGNDLLQAVSTVKPDVAVVDVSMPGPPFLELLPMLRARAPEVRILVVTAHPEAQYAVRALRSGASGYLTKDVSHRDLVVAIRDVASGRTHVTPSVAQHLAAALQTPGAPHEELSPREFEVLRLLARGHTVKQIGGSLELSVKTVSTYRTRVMEKLRARSTADLVRYAIDHGLIDDKS